METLLRIRKFQIRRIRISQFFVKNFVKLKGHLHYLARIKIQIQSFAQNLKIVN